VTTNYIIVALNLQDRKMTDKEISGGGNCRTDGKRRTKEQGWKMQDRKMAKQPPRKSWLAVIFMTVGLPIHSKH